MNVECFIVGWPQVCEVQLDPIAGCTHWQGRARCYSLIYLVIRTRVLSLLAQVGMTGVDKVYDAPCDQNTNRHAARPTELQFTASLSHVTRFVLFLHLLVT
jgi:hypothetical protein